MGDRGTGKVAVVTGGSRGLGFALVEELLGRGWFVVTDARRGDRLADAVGRLGSGSSLAAVVGDVADRAHRAAIAEAAARFGRVDLVVNNAGSIGTTPMRPVLDLDRDSFLETLEVNLFAPFALVATLAPNLADGATVINVTSDAGIEPYESWGEYGASKAALEFVSRILAVERSDLRILAVDPGDMRTDMQAAAFIGEDISDRPEPAVSVPGFMALIEGDAPSGRYVARDVATVDGGAA